MRGLESKKRWSKRNLDINELSKQPNNFYFLIQDMKIELPLQEKCLKKA